VHRGGAGPPLLCLHGFMDTWRTWELVLGDLERRHDVLAPTLPGHAGGSVLGANVSEESVLDDLETIMDRAGMPTADIAGNSLGGYLALRLAARGRARSVVAFAPAGGWPDGDPSLESMLNGQLALRDQMRALAPTAGEMLATAAGRRRASALIAEHYEHIPAELLADQMLGIALCDAEPLIDSAIRNGYTLDPELITCPLRIAWGTADRLLPWPSAATRFLEWFPGADWVELDGVGHCPQLDVPLEAAQLILGFTAG